MLGVIDRVFTFNELIVKIKKDRIQLLQGDELTWLMRVLAEETDELRVAQTTTDQVDALIDLTIFALGGLYRLGLSNQQAIDCFNAVMDANMEKRAGQKVGRVIGEVADAIKPEGWVGPEQRIAEILNGYKG